MRNLKLTLEYDGTHFHGWQIQNKENRTVQEELEKVLHRIFKKKIRVMGSGRTDSGVHALGQVAHFKIDTTKDLQEILFALNANLPEDVSIIEVEEVPEKFHAQFNAKSKTYRYTILRRKIRNPLHRNFSYFYPYPLNLRAIRTEAKELLGKKDFKAFTTSESARLKEGKSMGTIRTIKKIDIKKSGDFLYIDIEADGFLYKMVRNIVGTLLMIGTKKLPKGSLKEIVLRKDRKLGGRTAPAKGLCLLEVKYG